MSGPVVRRMRWWDIPAVAELEHQLFALDPWSVETFWAELAGVPKNRHYLVAEAAGEIVGYAGLLAVRDEGGIQTLAVAEAQQRTGLGRTLLDALLAEADRRGCRDVFLEVRAGNERAQSLYRRAGFEQIAHRRDYYGPGHDAVVMRRRAQS